MAATYTATAAQTFGTTGFFINPPRMIEKGYELKAVSMPIPISASNTCVLQMVPVPKGCQVQDVILAWDAAGTTTQFTFNVGDSNVNGRYILSASCTGSGVMRMGMMVGASTYNCSGGLGYSYSAETTVNVYCTAVASGSTTPAGTIRLTVLYSMDNNQKG